MPKQNIHTFTHRNNIFIPRRKEQLDQKVSTGTMHMVLIIITKVVHSISANQLMYDNIYAIIYAQCGFQECKHENVQITLDLSSKPGFLYFTLSLASIHIAKFSVSQSFNLLIHPHHLRE